VGSKRQKINKLMDFKSSTQLWSCIVSFQIQILITFSCPELTKHNITKTHHTKKSPLHPITIKVSAPNITGSQFTAAKMKRKMQKEKIFFLQNH
jgi:hypothetical protein